MSERKVFVIGDTHFLHENIIKYTGRPENFNRLIVENWNSVVSEDDLVFHLGDFSAGIKGRYELLANIGNMLNGEKVLIRGNHDHFSEDRYINEFGFTSVFDYLAIRDVLLTHYPLEITEYSKPKEIQRVKSMIGFMKNQKLNFVVHGHTHNRDVSVPGHYNCSVEQINFTPIELEVLLKGEVNGRFIG